MRTVTLLSLLLCLLSTIAALPASFSASHSVVRCHKHVTEDCPDADASLIFERGKDRPPAVTFRHDDESEHSAGVAIRRMPFKTEKQREAAKKYHIDLVTARMKTIPGAKTAEIVNLAHSRGSKDPHVHVSVQFMNRQGIAIPVPREGNPNQSSRTVHIYTNPKNKKEGASVLPKAYRKAVRKDQKKRHGKFDRI